MKKTLATLALSLLAASAFAQQGADLPKVDAEVRKVDAAQNRITLRHGDIPNIDMGAMTMVFRVKDPALLKDVKAGDKVRITAGNVDGALTLLSLEPAK